jgi:ribosomal protein S20
MEKQRPALAIMIGQALGKKGAPMKDKLNEQDEEDKEESPDSDYKMQLKEIAKDLLEAIKSEDVEAVAELLEEAFECCDSSPHKEGPYLGE